HSCSTWGIFAAALSFTADWCFRCVGTWGRLHDKRKLRGVVTVVCCTTHLCTALRRTLGSLQGSSSSLRNPVRLFPPVAFLARRIWGTDTFVAGHETGLVYN
ncbi:hypothetical protein H4582DRAFT_1987966, partial [Lactarius indigo]